MSTSVTTNNLSETSDSDSFREIEGNYLTLYQVIAGVLSGLMVVANVIVIVSVCKINRSKCSAFDTYCVALAFTDLAVGACLLPVYLAATFFKEWSWGLTLCVIWKTFDFGVTTVSLLLLLAIAYDRYRSVVSPLIYRAKSRRTRTIVVSIVSWIAGISVWVPFVTYKVLYSPERAFILRDRCIVANSSSESWEFIQTVMGYILPAFSTIIVYVFLVFSLRRRLQSPGEQIQSKLSDTQTDSNRFRGNSSNVSESPSKRAVHTNTMSQRILSQNITCYKNVSRLVLAFAVCWLPLMLAWSVDILSDITVPYKIYLFISALAYGNSLVNPVILILTYTQIRRNVVRCYRRK